MGILRISRVNTLLLGITMMAILLCWSSQVQAAQSGDYAELKWSYKVEHSSDYSIYRLFKVSPEGIQTELTSDNKENIVKFYEYGNYIYFLTSQRSGMMGEVFTGSIYRIKFDGTGKERIDSGKDQYDQDNGIADFIIFNNSIYYIPRTNDGNDFKIWKSELDGSNKVQIGQDRTFSMASDGQKIYYVKEAAPLGNNKWDSTGVGLYCMNSDGSNRLKIDDNTNASNKGDVIVRDGWYQQNTREDSDEIFNFKVRFHNLENNKEVSLISNSYWDDWYSLIGAYDGWIYYYWNTSISEQTGLYRIQENGSNNTLISSNFKAYDESVSNGWIYYRDSDNNKWYKMKVDGTDNQVIDTTGVIEMKTAQPIVTPSKIWTIKLNGLVNEASINDKVYVTDSQGNIQPTTNTVSTVNGLSQIKVNSTNTYAPGDYILWVKNIKSIKEVGIKKQVFMKFTVK